MKNSRLFFTATFFTMALLSGVAVRGQEHIQEKGQVLSGTVIDSQSRRPIAHVCINIKDTEEKVFSDEEGKFEIRTATSVPVHLMLLHENFNEEEIEYSDSEGTFMAYLTPVPMEDTGLNELVITSRRRSEVVQDVPIPIAVIDGGQIEQMGAFNINRIKELVPSVQLYSSNPRNTALNIRGLGTTFGFTNDGIDPGVGLYIDGVYHARPAAAALDFIDVERVEVLRGPQGTLFGKNTTAGAFNIISKKPKFHPASEAELSYGNYSYIQAKTTITGGFSDKMAGRLSFSGTRRNGVIENVRTGKYINDWNNIGLKGQWLFEINESAELLLSADYASQRPDGYAQVVAGVVKTKRPDYRQFDQIIADLGYELPSRNAFDRKIDHDTPWRSDNDLGGIALNYEQYIGNGKLTATSAGRFWNWDPSNDRDFTGLPVLTRSEGTSKHRQWSQEVRYAGNVTEKITGILGIYGMGQDLKTNPYHTEESGAAQARFSQNSTSPLWNTPGLFDGYGIRTKSRLQTLSAAVFGQIDWAVSNKWHILPGLRYNYDEKEVDYDRQTYGGLDTEDPELIALKKVVYSDQQFQTRIAGGNFSGQLTIQYKWTEKINMFATFAKSFKPAGVNLGGLPSEKGRTLTELAVVKPEEVAHYEVGFKSNPAAKARLNITAYNTVIHNYQTQVQTAELGVNRGYLANAEKVHVKGLEMEGHVQVLTSFSITTSLSYTDGRYDSFKNAPVPLEETGGEQAFKDVSGGRLPGISKWAGSLGLEYVQTASFFDQEGTFFAAVDSYFRSCFSSSPSPSRYLNIPGYGLLHARMGFRVTKGCSVFLWGKNIGNKNYYEHLLAAPGNAGHYAAVLGDPATYGITLKYVLN